MISFWAFLAILSVTVCVFAIFTGASKGEVGGMILGFTGMGFVFWAISTLSISTILIVFGLLIIVGIFRIQIGWERQRNKFIAGRPEGER